MSLNPSVPNDKMSLVVVSNVQLGLRYLHQGDRPRAKQKLLKALYLAPNRPETNAAFAYFLEITGDLALSQSYYQKAIHLAPTSGAQLNNYGSFLCRQGHYKEAEQYFLRAVKDVHYIHSAEAYEHAGICIAKLPDYPKAITYFTKSLRQDPSRKEALYHLVSLEMQVKKFKQAKMHLARYSELVLTNPKLQTLALKVEKYSSGVHYDNNHKQHNG